MENYGIFLRKMIEIVAVGDTIILNFQFSILNYLSFRRNDKYEFDTLCIIEEKEGYSYGF